MKTVVIDTNALISFVTDRNPLQQEKVFALLNDAAERRVGVICHQQVITEFVYVMEKIYHVDDQVIHQMIKDLIAMPGIEITHDLDMNRLLGLWPTPVADFGDAVLAAVCKSRKDAALLSFDVRFGKEARKLGIKVLTL